MQNKDKLMFTTSQVAQILHISTRTVSKLFDSDVLTGYRLNKDRRISRVSIQRYCEDRNITMLLDKAREEGLF